MCPCLLTTSNTLAGIHGNARMIFKKAVDFDLIKQDPTEFAKLPRKVSTVEEQTEELPKFMEAKELALFLKTTRETASDEVYALFRLLAYYRHAPW